MEVGSTSTWMMSAYGANSASLPVTRSSNLAPMAMIFTPCRDGITHNHREHADLARTEPGVNVLLHAALARANR